MNTDTPRTSTVTDEEYQQALTSWATAQKESSSIAAELVRAEAEEMRLYKALKDIRATVAKETLEKIR